MALEETTQRSEDSNSTDNLQNTQLSNSTCMFNSSQNVGNNSVAGDSETANFIVIVRSLAIVFGVVGFVMNGFVLIALLPRKHRNNTSYTFLVNQIIMDTLSSLLLIVVYAYKLAAVDYYYEGPGGFAMCILLNSDVLVFTVQTGSIASLVLIAAERYFKIVFPFLHKRYYKNWMTYVGIAFTWTNGILMNICILWTSRLVNGNCFTLRFWPTPTAGTKYILFLVSWQFVIPLMLFIGFYGSILVVVRKTCRVLQGNYDEDVSNSFQRNARRSQMNIVVTMFAVSLSFVVSWFPNQSYVILNKVGVLPSSTIFYSSSTLFIFFNNCVNPLIYASKHELVRKNIRRMFAKKELNDCRHTLNSTQNISTVA